MKIGTPPPAGRMLDEGKLFPKASSAEQKSADTSLFPQGRLIKGTVLSFAENGQTLLSIGGKTLTAESLVPLKVGQELWLEVVREGALPQLALAGKKAAVGELLRLVSSLDFGRMFSQGGGQVEVKLPDAIGAGGQALPFSVEQFLKLYAEGALDSEPDPAKLLKNAIALGFFDKLHLGSGEHKLRQHQLLDFLLSHSQQGGSDAVTGMEEGKGIVRLLKLFEAFAQLNSQAVGPEQNDFLLFPCFFSGESGWGEWLYSFGKEEEADGGAGQTYGLSFFLELSNLGELHFQVRIKEKSLQGVFSVPDEAVSQHLAENLKDLSRALNNLGFHPVGLTCQVRKAANLHRLKEELSDLAGKDSFSLVDVTI